MNSLILKNYKGNILDTEEDNHSNDFDQEENDRLEKEWDALWGEC